MPSHGAKSEAQRSLAALRLAAGGTQEQAAGDSGVAERTVRKWLADDPAFVAEVDRLRGEIIGRACGLMAARLAAAGEELGRLLTDPESRVRLRAAVAIHELALDLRAAADDARRLDELERRLNEKPQMPEGD